jgi:hypothetical protein
VSVPFFLSSEFSPPSIPTTDLVSRCIFVVVFIPGGIVWWYWFGLVLVRRYWFGLVLVWWYWCGGIGIGIGLVSVWYRFGIGLVSVWYRFGIGLVLV